MADIEGLLHEVADAVISCKKEKLLEVVEKQRLSFHRKKSLRKGFLLA